MLSCSGVHIDVCVAGHVHQLLIVISCMILNVFFINTFIQSNVDVVEQ